MSPTLQTKGWIEYRRFKLLRFCSKPPKKDTYLCVYIHMYIYISKQQTLYIGNMQWKTTTFPAHGKFPEHCCWEMESCQNKLVAACYLNLSCFLRWLGGPAFFVQPQIRPNRNCINSATARCIMINVCNNTPPGPGIVQSSSQYIQSFMHWLKQGPWCTAWN